MMDLAALLAPAKWLQPLVAEGHAEELTCQQTQQWWGDFPVNPPMCTWWAFQWHLQKGFYPSFPLEQVA